MAEQGIAGTLKDVELLSIWKLCEILSYNATIADKNREEIEKNKRKFNKK